MINLDKNFSPLGTENAIQFQSFVFAGGEPHIKITDDFDAKPGMNITHRINSFNDLGLICIHSRCLEAHGC